MKEPRRCHRREKILTELIQRIETFDRLDVEAGLMIHRFAFDLRKSVGSEVAELIQASIVTFQRSLAEKADSDTVAHARRKCLALIRAAAR